MVPEPVFVRRSAVPFAMIFKARGKAVSSGFGGDRTGSGARRRGVVVRETGYEILALASGVSGAAAMQTAAAGDSR